MILVSGATGFMGSAIARHLLAGGMSVRAMGRSAGKAEQVLTAFPEGKEAAAEGRLSFASADVTRPETLLSAVEGVDCIVQAAQFPGAPVENPARGLTYANIDRNGTINLLQAVESVFAAETGGTRGKRYPDNAPHFLYLSGVTVSETAPESWNRAKWQAEEALRGSGLPWTIIRASWSYGPGDRSLNRLLGFSDYLPFVPVFGNGKERVTPLYVEDVGRFFALAVERPEASVDITFALGGPEVLTMNQIMEIALKVKGRRRFLLHIPKSVGKAQASLLQLLPGRPLTPDAVDFITQGGVADDTRITEKFPGFQTTRFREALEGYLS